jgi:O-antigen/teichoic acid export membrane protein
MADVVGPGEPRTTANLPTQAPGDKAIAGGEESHVSRMARGGSLNLVGALVQQASLFAVMAILAHGLGRADVGRYSEMWSLLSLLGLLSLAGFRSGLTRFIAVFLAEGDASRVRGTIRLGMRVTMIGSLLIGSLLAVFAPAVADYFHDPSLVTGVRLTALILPATTFSDAALAATQGWRSQKAFALIGRVLDPLSMLGLIGLAVLLVGRLNAALVISSWSTALWSGIALRRRVRTVPKAHPIMEPRRIFSFSMISWASALAATGLIWAGTILLGNLTDPASVGVFNVASRLVNLAVFVMAPITTAFTPHMAHLDHVGEKAQAARAYGNATRWILFLSAPAFVMLIVLPEQMLAFFGRDFRTGAEVTMILAAGQLIAAAAGPCGVVLNQSGRVVLSLVDNIGVLVGNVLLSLVLIPRYGIVGAASAWSISLIAVNLTKLLQARYIVGVTPVGAGTIRTILASLPAAGVAWLVRETVHNAYVAVLVGGLAVLVVYVGAHLLAGLHPDDKALLRRYLPRWVGGRPRGPHARYRA